jgi:hypothetical protein
MSAHHQIPLIYVIIEYRTTRLPIAEASILLLRH